MGFKKFIKSWMLVISMVVGALLYVIYMFSPVLHPYGGSLLRVVHILQPTLLFMMLFLTFCRVRPSDLKLERWQLWLLLIQGGLFAILAVVVRQITGSAEVAPPMAVVLEAGLLCIICPTATACPVITSKLGGSISGVLTYTIMINLLVSVLVPLFVPFFNPMENLSFTESFLRILSKVFPLLIAPCLLAWVVRFAMPSLHARLLKHTELSFYLWAVSLTFAITMSARAIVHSKASLALLAGIAAVSLVACIFQFAAGKKIGAIYGEKITAGQALGQKNTVFAIWLAYSFMTPVVSVAGGFYSIWHNCFNTWQLQHMRNKQQ